MKFLENIKVVVKKTISMKSFGKDAINDYDNKSKEILKQLLRISDSKGDK